MNIWHWVEERLGRLVKDDPRLAFHVSKLSSWTVNDQHERVDAVFPEVLAQVRSLEDPWLEVFVRHWRLQSLVLNRHDVVEGLPEAVDLLERAHRPDAADCPQTVCVSQDVCSAYACADGPGWAKERLEVSRQTLSRIDPSWSCWTCISGEHADALNDDGQPEQALSFVEAQLGAMRSAGEEVVSGYLAWQKVDALLRLDRKEEALAVCEAAENPLAGTGFQLGKRVHTARCLVALDRLEEAEAALPSGQEIRVRPALWEAWARAVVNGIRKRGTGWSREARNPLVDMARSLEGRGNLRHAFNLWFSISALDIGFNMLAEGRAAADRAEALLGRLKAPCGADAQLAQLRDALGRVDWPELPEERAAAELFSESGLNMTQAVVLAERFPDWWAIVSGVASTWRASGHPEHAVAVLRAAMAAGVEPATYALANTLTDLGDADGLEALVVEVQGAAKAFFTSIVAQLRGDAAGAIAALEGHDTDPQLVERRMELLYNGQDWGALLASAKAFIASGAEPGDVDWKLLVAATFVGDHAAARVSAERLEMELTPSSGPIDERWGSVVLAEGEQHWFAMRTGPVTAMILQVTGPQSAERHGDVVVFHPAPMNPEEEEAYRVFPTLAVLRTGGFRGFALDAVHPGDEALAAFTSALHAAGYPSWISSNVEYSLDRPDGEEVPGLYLRVAVPPDRSLQELADRFAAVEWGLAWLELAQALGDEAEVTRQQAIIEAWEL